MFQQQLAAATQRVHVDPIHDPNDLGLHGLDTPTAKDGYLIAPASSPTPGRVS